MVDIILIDCLGRTFPKFQHLVNVNVRAFSRNRDVAEVKLHEESGVLSVLGKKLGRSEVVVEIYVDGSLKAYDVVPISVNVLILPLGPLTVHVGGTVRFSIPDSA